VSCSQDRNGKSCLDAVQRYDTLFSTPSECPSGPSSGSSDVLLSFEFSETGCASSCRQGLSEWVQQFACCSTQAAQEQQLWWQRVSISGTSSFSLDTLYGAFPIAQKYSAPEACSDTARHVSTLCAVSRLCAPISVMVADGGQPGGSSSSSSSSRVAPLDTCCSAAVCLRGQRRPEQRCMCQCNPGWSGVECRDQRSYLSTIFFLLSPPDGKRRAHNAQFFPLQVEEGTKENLALVHLEVGVGSSDISINRVYSSNDCLHQQSDLAIEVRIIVRQIERPEREQAQRIVAAQLQANRSGALLAHGLRLSCNARLAQGEFFSKKSCDEDPKCCSNARMSVDAPCCSLCATAPVASQAVPPDSTPKPLRTNHPFLSADVVSTATFTVWIAASISGFLGIGLMTFCCLYYQKRFSLAQALAIKFREGAMSLPAKWRTKDTDNLPVSSNGGQTSKVQGLPGNFNNKAFPMADSAGGASSWRKDEDIRLQLRQWNRSTSSEAASLAQQDTRSAVAYFLDDEHLGMHLQLPAKDLTNLTDLTDLTDLKTSHARGFPVTLSVSPADVSPTRVINLSSAEVDAMVLNDGHGFGGPPKSLFQVVDREGAGGGGGKSFSPFFFEQANARQHSAQSTGMNSSKFENISPPPPPQQQQQQHSAPRTGMMQLSSISKFEPATSMLAKRGSGDVGSSKFEPDSSHAVPTPALYINRECKVSSAKSRHAKSQMSAPV
jgi:hypothetical protein